MHLVKKNSFSLILPRVLSEITAIDHNLLFIQKIVIYACVSVFVHLFVCVYMYVLYMHIYNVHIKQGEEVYACDYLIEYILM